MAEGMAEATQELPVQASPTNHKRRAFLRGPFNLAQFHLAANLGRAPLVVWLLVHHQARLTRRSAVTLPDRLVQPCGIGRHTKWRAVQDLERVGLISVERGPGKAARIALVVLSDAEGAPGD